MLLTGVKVREPIETGKNMGKTLTRLACVAIFGVLASVPAAAGPPNGNGAGNNGPPPASKHPGQPGKNHGNKGAPAPVTGAGLPFLVAAGAFAAFKRRRRSY
jgi:hypothetical protein